MPPTMILIGVCACAGAADMSRADIAAKRAAARILRMGVSLWRRLSEGRFGDVLAGPWFREGTRFAAGSRAMRPPARCGVNRGFGGVRWRALAKLLSSLRFTARGHCHGRRDDQGL